MGFKPRALLDEVERDCVGAGGDGTRVERVAEPDRIRCSSLGLRLKHVAAPVTNVAEDLSGDNAFRSTGMRDHGEDLEVGVAGD